MSYRRSNVVLLMMMMAVLVTGTVLAVVLAAVGVSAGRSQDRQERFSQWEQCELNSNGSGGASDPCGPMPVP